MITSHRICFMNVNLLASCSLSRSSCCTRNEKNTLHPCVKKVVHCTVTQFQLHFAYHGKNQFDGTLKYKRSQSEESTTGTTDARRLVREEEEPLEGRRFLPVQPGSLLRSTSIHPVKASKISNSSSMRLYCRFHPKKVETVGRPLGFPITAKAVQNCVKEAR